MEAIEVWVVLDALFFGLMADECTDIATVEELSLFFVVG